MKAPICDICLRSSILCPACKKKLDRREISDSDISVSRKLFEASDRFNSLKGVQIRKIIETPNNIILISGIGDAARIIGKAGMIVKDLSKSLGKNVRVIEETSDKRDFIERVIFPSKIIAMNVLFKEDREVLKIIISPERQLPLGKDNLNEIVKQVFDQDILIVK